MAVVRDFSQNTNLAEIGCEVVVADILDSVALAKAFDGFDAVQVIVPPRPSAPDGAQEMRDMVASLGKAIDLAQPKRVLGISDYGAHVSKDIGMPTLCRELEERLKRCSGHKIILRSAEHMQNLARGIAAAVTSSTLHVFNDPITSRRPTISAYDLGPISATLLMRPGHQQGREIFHAEGPRRYSAEDTAQSLGILLSRTIRVESVPRAEWERILQGAMSESLADLLVKGKRSRPTTRKMKEAWWMSNPVLQNHSKEQPI